VRKAAQEVSRLDPIGEIEGRARNGPAFLSVLGANLQNSIFLRIQPLGFFDPHFDPGEKFGLINSSATSRSPSEVTRPVFLIWKKRALISG